MSPGIDPSVTTLNPVRRKYDGLTSLSLVRRRRAKSFPRGLKAMKALRVGPCRTFPTPHRSFLLVAPSYGLPTCSNMLPNPAHRACGLGRLTSRTRSYRTKFRSRP